MIEESKPIEVREGVDNIRKSNEFLDAFSIFLVAAVAVALLVAVVVYRISFSGDLSVSSNDWSAFGSYIGGIFSPLISFLTLLAILKTIGLQKKLLETQRHEFDAMQALQVRTLDSQLAQIKRSNFDADRRVVEETRLNVLNTLQSLTRGLQSEYEIKLRGFETLAQWVMDGKTPLDKEKMITLRTRLDNFEGRLSALNLLYSDLCFNDFKNARSIRDYYQSEMERICGEWQVSNEINGE